jgi:hypothetical protein
MTLGNTGKLAHQLASSSGNQRQAIDIEGTLDGFLWLPCGKPRSEVISFLYSPPHGQVTWAWYQKTKMHHLRSSEYTDSFFYSYMELLYSYMELLYILKFATSWNYSEMPNSRKLDAIHLFYSWWLYTFPHQARIIIIIIIIIITVNSSESDAPKLILNSSIAL